MQIPIDKRRSASIETTVVVALIAAAIALFGTFATHRLNLARERNSARRVAATAFHDGFADTLLNLKSNDIATARIVQQFCVRHEAVIVAFEPYVPKRKKKQFEAAVKQFNDACQEYKGVGVLGLFATELGPQASENRRSIVERIECLLAFAPLI